MQSFPGRAHLRRRHDAAALVAGAGQALHQWIGRDPGGPDHRRGGDRLAVGQEHAVVPHFLEGGAGADLDPLVAQPTLHPGGEVVAQVAQDGRRRFEDHEAQHRRAEPRIVAQGIHRRGMQLGGGLGARVAAADEDEGQQPAPQRVVRRRVGDLQVAEQPVAQLDGLGQCLEPQGVLGESGNARRHPRRAAEGEDQVVEGEHAGIAVGGADRHGALGHVDADHAGDDDARPLERGAQRHDEVTRLERAGRGLGQQRRVEQVILVGRQDQLVPRSREPPLEMMGCVEAAKPAAENENARHQVSVYSGPLPPSGGVNRPPLAVIAPHWTQLGGFTTSTRAPLASVPHS